MTNYLTIRDAAEKLSVSINTIRSLLPQLGAVDMRGGAGKNRMIRIPEDAILAYLSGCEIPRPLSFAELQELAAEEENPKPFRLERRRA